MNLRKLIVLLLIQCVYVGKIYSQETVRPTAMPSIAIKSNVLSDIATTFNLGGEFKINNQWTADLSLSYNPWSFANNKKMKHVLIQPEGRYWLCEAFNGHFVGIHAHYSLYNIGGIGVTDYMKNHRFEGWLIGAGISYGYHWMLSDRWSLEATVGLGYAYLDYEVYPCEKCAKKLHDKTKNYFGPTKLGVSLIYILK